MRNGQSTMLISGFHRQTRGTGVKIENAGDKVRKCILTQVRHIFYRPTPAEKSHSKYFSQSASRSISSKERKKEREKNVLCVSRFTGFNNELRDELRLSFQYSLKKKTRPLTSLDARLVHVESREVSGLLSNLLLTDSSAELQSGTCRINPIEAMLILRHPRGRHGFILSTYRKESAQRNR